MYCFTDIALIRYRIPIIILFLITGVSVISFGQSKPVIQIQFKMLEPNYVEFYNWDNSVGYIDSAASLNLGILLRKRFPFIQFTSAPAKNKLLVELDKHHEANSNSLTATVELSMQFQDESGVPYQVLYETFRETGQAFQGLPDDKNAFLLELQSVFERWVKNKYEDILNKVCYNVKMCTVAHPMSELNSWVIPFSTTEMNIATRSNFRIEAKTRNTLLPGVCDYQTTVQGNADIPTLPAKFKGKMRCQYNAQSIDGTCIQNLSNLEIQGVYLTNYKPYVLAEAPPD